MGLVHTVVAQRKLTIVGWYVSSSIWVMVGCMIPTSSCDVFVVWGEQSKLCRIMATPVIMGFEFGLCKVRFVSLGSATTNHIIMFMLSLR